MRNQKLDPSDIVLVLLIAVCVARNDEAVHAVEPVRWSGQGKYRLVVEVKPTPLEGRTRDELPAELEVNLTKELAKLGIESRADIASLQVIQYEPATGKPVKYLGYAYAKSAFDRPFRWYDAAIPYDFPEFHNDVSRTDGKIVRRNRIRAGYFFNALGEWQSGRLAWMHTQVSDQPTLYSVYFDLLPHGKTPSEVPPRAWLGDGLPRCDREGSSSMGADHCRIEFDDWNDDGLIDLIAGENYGHVFWWPNVGTKQHPKYRFYKFVFDSKGLPIDTGMVAAPKVVDWDSDGKKDLLVGTEWNRILFYRNVGTNKERKLDYRGFVKLDGQTLQLPIKPLERGSTEVFRRDYYPVLETVDWDNDGDFDLLAGGYITGRIFFYKNEGRKEDGTPKLNFDGPLMADGKALNVGHWCAAPCIADFDGDGDLDLMSGNMPMHSQPNDRGDRTKDFLQYFENSGSSQEPRLRSRPFPAEGTFPHTHLATPRAYDWDADGDLDLAVSARENIYLCENKGTRTSPQFVAHTKPLPSPWGGASLAVDQFRDWNGDGRLDLIRNYTVRINTGVGNPFGWSRTQPILPPDEYIMHPSGIGDDWFWPFLDDFDQDGKLDILFGDWHGHIWFHRNLSTDKREHFDVKGTRLRLTNGDMLKVGPIGKDPKTDFTALQGARTVFTVADFDRDEIRDLVVGDTYGKVRYFRNAGTRKAPRFDAGIEIGDLGIRLLVDATDWNNDGWPDIIAGAASGKVRVILNNKGETPSPFADGFDPKLPPILQPRVLMADINGDGDEDLFLPSTQGSCLIERSFLRHGYAKAKLIAVEMRRRPTPDIERR